MQLQIFPNGLVTTSEAKILDTSGVYKIPLGIYQDMCDLAQFTKGPQVVRKYLEDFVEARFPGKVLNAFIDLSNADIQNLQSKGIYGLTWGMYIQVIEPNLILDSPLIDSITNLLGR